MSNGQCPKCVGKHSESIQHNVKVGKKNFSEFGILLFIPTLRIPLHEIEKAGKNTACTVEKYCNSVFVESHSE